MLEFVSEFVQARDFPEQVFDVAVSASVLFGAPVALLLLEDSKSKEKSWAINWLSVLSAESVVVAVAAWIVKNWGLLDS